MIDDHHTPGPGGRRSVPMIVTLVTSIGLVACGGTSATPVNASARHGEHRSSTTSPSTTASSTSAGSPSAPAPAPATGSSQSSANPSAVLAPPSSIPAGTSERQAAQQAVDAIDADFVAQNWAALYKASASQIRQSQSLQAFVSSMQSQAMPKILSATLTGAGSASTQNGSTYWTQPIELEASTNGGAPVPYHAEVELVDQGGQWAFLATSTPTPGL